MFMMMYDKASQMGVESPTNPAMGELELSPALKQTSFAKVW